MNRFKRTLLITIGFICVLVGIIGIIIPLVPTTPLLLLGAACWMRGSKKLHLWLLNNKFLGTYIKQYQDGLGIPIKTKIFVITFIWLSITFSALIIVPNIWVKILLFMIAAGITWYISSIKTLKSEKPDEVGINKPTAQ